MDMTLLKKSAVSALSWAQRHSLPGSGIVISSVRREAYPEVTGYWIPTLLQAGEEPLARQYAGFLARVQAVDGGIVGPDGREFFFDTAQVLRGWLSMSALTEEFRAPARAAADYLTARISSEGIIQDDYKGFYDDIPAAINLYALSPLCQAAVVFNESRYLKAAEKAAHVYAGQFIGGPKDVLTHFLAYMIDGLWENGMEAAARPLLQAVLERQRHDGSLSGREHSWWVCSVGVAQFAVLAYKAGMVASGDRALSYLCRRQNKSGGFFGSYGWGARYFHQAEISWANKFFLDAVLLRYGPSILAKGA